MGLASKLNQGQPAPASGVPQYASLSGYAPPSGPPPTNSSQAPYPPPGSQSGYGTAPTNSTQAPYPPPTSSTQAPYPPPGSQSGYGTAPSYAGSQSGYGTAPSYAGSQNSYGTAYRPPAQSPYGYPPTSQSGAPSQPGTAYGNYAPPTSSPYGSTPYSPAGAYPPAAGSAYSTGNNYTQPAMGSGYGGKPAYNLPPADNLQTVLDRVINSKDLRKFYGSPQSLTPILNKLNTVNFSALANQWRISEGTCRHLASLALYDIVVYCDDSGSMAFEENGSRIDDLKMILERIAQIATLFDDDGILVRFFNSTVEGNGINNLQQVNDLLSQVKFSGLTPLGTQLERKILEPFFFNAVERRSFNKPLLIFVVTDGEPSGEPRDKLLQVTSRLLEVSRQCGYGQGAVAIQLAQVGKDEGAQRFLSSLDNNPVVKEIIDTTSYYELEEAEVAKKGGVLTPEMWLIKLMLGAVEPYFDNQD